MDEAFHQSASRYLLTDPPAPQEGLFFRCLHEAYTDVRRAAATRFGLRNYLAAP